MKQLIYLRALARVLARRFNPWPSEMDGIFSLKPLFCGIYPSLAVVMGYIFLALGAFTGSRERIVALGVLLGLQVLVAPWWLHWLRNSGLGAYLRDLFEDVEIEVDGLRSARAELEGAMRSLPVPDTDLTSKARLEDLAAHNRRVCEQVERDLTRSR